jgi:hypothetical protein
LAKAGWVDEEFGAEGADEDKSKPHEEQKDHLDYDTPPPYIQ